MVTDNKDKIKRLKGFLKPHQQTSNPKSFSYEVSVTAVFFGIDYTLKYKDYPHSLNNLT